jgi:hypothetical protein
MPILQRVEIASGILGLGLGFNDFAPSNHHHGAY